MYFEIVEKINEGIVQFNKFLSSDHQLMLLNEAYLADSNPSWKLLDEGWEDRTFPNGNSRGVYFIFGKNSENNESSAVYVGKASYSDSMIGKRLYSHLNTPSRNERIYPMNHKSGSKYHLEFITTIPLDNVPFLASALEEYLIAYLRDSNVDLLNHVGN